MENNPIEYKLKEFISEYWNYKPDKLRLNTTLDDIGMYGDDKLDFLVNLAKKINLSIEKIPLNKYIDNEGGYFLGYFIVKYIFRKKVREIYPISISMLIKWIETDEWKG